MKKLFLNLYVFIFLIVSDYALYAQGPTEDTPEGGDPVPINGKIVILAIVAISFAYYYFSKRREEKQLTSN